MKKILGSILLIVGSVLIAIPFYVEWNGQKEVRAMEEAISLISQSDGEEVDLSTIKNLALTEDEIKDVLELEIPFINLKQHILSETTDANLNIALTQIKPDQIPGRGNFTVAGHRGFRDGRHFSNLAKVPVGEVVYLHSNDTTYEYKLTSSEVIEPTYLEILDHTVGKNELTLITCTLSGADRVAVKGELVGQVSR